MAQSTHIVALSAGVENSQVAPAETKVMYFWTLDGTQPAKYKGTTSEATELVVPENILLGPFAVTPGEEVFFESVGTATVSIIFETGIRN